MMYAIFASSDGWKSKIPMLIQRRAPFRGRTIASGTPGISTKIRSTKTPIIIGHERRRAMRYGGSATHAAAIRPMQRNATCFVPAALSTVRMARMPRMLSSSAAPTLSSPKFNHAI